MHHSKGERSACIELGLNADVADNGRPGLDPYARAAKLDCGSRGAAIDRAD